MGVRFWIGTRDQASTEIRLLLVISVCCGQYAKRKPGAKPGLSGLLTLMVRLRFGSHCVLDGTDNSHQDRSANG